MTEINIEAFKNAWFSFDEINKLIKSEQYINDWKFITQEEMNNFIKNEIFCKYTINA